MILISDSKVYDRYIDKNAKLMSYDDFIEKLFDSGFEESDKLYININDLKSYDDYSDKELFDELSSYDNIKWFSSNGEAPDFSAPAIESGNMLDWSQDSDDSYSESEDLSDEESEIADLMQKSVSYDDEDDVVMNGEKNDDSIAKIIVFGSSKGGTGKTFTSIISTYRYAKQNPDKKIALVDFDLIDGQVGISIHKIKPTMRNYYTSYSKGYDDFSVMKEYSVKANKKYPSNVDFYLAPSNGMVVKDDDFWYNVIKNLIENYDLVVFDTGIDYLNIRPIAYAYMAADKINLVTTTSIKSVTSVGKQISKLKGITENATYSQELGLESKINVIITQMIQSDEMNRNIYKTLKSQANVVATFGVITESVSRAEFFGEWDVFDENAAINKSLDNIMSL